MYHPALKDIHAISSVIDAVEFHDLPVKSIHFAFEQKTVILVVSHYNETKSDYDQVEFRFVSVSDLTFQDHDLLACEEITNCDVEEDGDRIRILFTFLTGSAGPSLDMGFSFGMLSVRTIE